jgi:PAS domain-containing protein
MTSESSARSLPAIGPAADAFRAFFDTIDAPAALCDADLRIATANAAFEALCGATALEGRRLSDLLDQVPLSAPGEGRSQHVDVLLRTGQSVALTFTRRGETVAVVARQAPSLGSLPPGGRCWSRPAWSRRCSSWAARWWAR